MCYIKAQHINHPKASFSKFWAAWGGGGPQIRSHSSSSFILGRAHYILEGWADSCRRCGVCGTSKTYKQQKVTKLFRIQVQNKFKGTNNVGATWHQSDLCCGQWVILVQVTRRGYASLSDWLLFRSWVYSPPACTVCQIANLTSQFLNNAINYLPEGSENSVRKRAALGVELHWDIYVKNVDVSTDEHVSHINFYL